MNTSKLKRHTLVVIDGQPCQLTSKPQKAIDGTWIVFYRCEVGGRVTYSYLTGDELSQLAETVTV